MCRTSRFTCAALAACGWLAWSAAALAEDHSADQILAEIKAVQYPRLDASSRDNPEAVKDYQDRLIKIWTHKKELILELYRVDPDNAEIPALMEERWRRSGGEDPEVLFAEFDDVLAHTKSEVLRGHALFRKALRKADAVRSNPGEGDAALAAIEDFIRHAPKDERGAVLLLAYAKWLKGSPEKQAEIQKRVVSEYPEHPRARTLKGKFGRSERVGKPFELEFTDAINGKHISMNGLRGKVVVIDFWATWCGPCIAAMPRMKELYEEYHGRGVEFIGVSLDRPQDKGGLDRLKAFVEKNAIPWPQYYQGNEWESEFSTSWGINAIPAVFVVDQEGNLHSTDAHGKLEEMIPELLARGKVTDSR